MLLAAAVIVVTATTTAPPRDTSHNSLPADRGGRLPLAGTTSAPVAAFPARADQPDDPLAGFDDYAKAALADWRTPGMAIAIVKDGKAVLARGYGIRRVGENDPVDEQTVFPIASVTKVFTATCLAQLVEEGRLQWSDPVVKHLPEFKLSDPYLTKNVQIADLLSHRTGLETADLLAYRGDYDRAEILRRMQYLQPVAPFRSRYVYNNLMLVTAGEVLERVAQESWPVFLKNRLVEPLGMSATFASPRELVELGNVSTPHVLSDGRLIPDPAWSRDKGAEGFRHFHETVAAAGGNSIQRRGHGQVPAPVSGRGRCRRQTVANTCDDSRDARAAQHRADQGDTEAQLRLSTVLLWLWPRLAFA
jgi:CubicO group peptidase (beta-lactamase class C family)